MDRETPLGPFRWKSTVAGSRVSYHYRIEHQYGLCYININSNLPAREHCFQNESLF